MPDQEEWVRIAGNITCVVTSLDTAVTFIEIARKLLLVETLEEWTITEDIEGALAATVAAKGATERERSIGHPREGTLRGTVTAKGTTEEERLTGHPRKGTETTTTDRYRCRLYDTASQD